MSNFFPVMIALNLSRTTNSLKGFGGKPPEDPEEKEKEERVIRYGFSLILIVGLGYLLFSFFK